MGLSDDRFANRSTAEDYYVRNSVAGLTWHRVTSPLVSTLRLASGYDGEIR
jgi:hypothetical protein